MPTRHTTDRAVRVRAIADGAHVRHALGQAAQHELLADGQHLITFRGRRFTGKTVEEGIAVARALVQGIVTEGCK